MGILQGIRVLDFTRIYAGPLCTLLLCELGAEVIKVERREGDVVRNDAPLTKGSESGTFIILNRGKKSITLNLATEKGREICRHLAQQVDIVVENFAPGTMERLGLSAGELRKLNPRLIYTAISAYGQTGLRRDELGYDPVIQATAGLMSVTGFPHDPPTKCGVAVADFCAGLFATIATLAALWHRAETGEGQLIDISIQDCLWFLTSIEFSPHYFLTGRVPARLGNGHPAMVPGNVYPAKDGWVIIAIGTLSQVESLYRTMGKNDLISTPLCSNQSERVKYRDQIDQLVAEWTRTKTVENIVRLLKGAGVPCTRVPTFEEVCNDNHLLSREMIVEVEQTVSGKVKTPGSVFKLSKTPGQPCRPAPFLGEHNSEVLGSMLGYSEQEINELVSAGVI